MSINENSIRISLRRALSGRGLDEKEHAHLYDMVDDYMALWRTKQLLIADIDKRGVNVEWQNSATQKGFKKNDSVGELHKTNAQMLNVLKYLDIDATPAGEVRVVEDVEEQPGLL